MEIIREIIMYGAIVAGAAVMSWVFMKVLGVLER